MERSAIPFVEEGKAFFDKLKAGPLTGFFASLYPHERLKLPRRRRVTEPSA